MSEPLKRLRCVIRPTAIGPDFLTDGWSIEEAAKDFARVAGLTYREIGHGTNDSVNYIKFEIGTGKEFIVFSLPSP